MKVFVYWNLHRKTYSIRAMEGAKKGLVVGHADEMTLHNVEFRVSEAGRQRVLRYKRKNVHAGVVGYIPTSDLIDESIPYDTIVKYNPYLGPKFTAGIGHVPVSSARRVRLESYDKKPTISAIFGECR
jgi:hypothetical protein